MDFVETRKFKDKYEEFRYGDWRKGSGKTFVTLETEIPAVPEKLLEKPDEAAFRKRLAELSGKINDIHNGIEEKKTQFQDTLTKLKGEDQPEADEETPDISHESLSQKFAQAKEMRTKRNKQQDKVDNIQQEIQKVRNEMRFLNDNIDKFFNKPELVPKGLKQAEKDFYMDGNEKEFKRR